MNFKKVIVLGLKKIEYASAIAVRLTKYTGKSRTYLHPKHLITQNPWYIRYINKNDVVLDLGCSSGQSSIKAAKIAKKVIGVDFDESLLKLAKETAKRGKTKNVEFKKVNLEKGLKYKENSFDKIIFLDVLEHLVERDQILKDIKRILKKDGLLFVGVPNKDTSWKKTQRETGVCSFSDPDHKIEFSKKEILDLFKKHGFKIINVSYSTFDTAYRGLYDIVGAFSLSLYRSISKWRQDKANKYPQEASGFQIVAQK